MQTRKWPLRSQSAGKQPFEQFSSWEVHIDTSSSITAYPSPKSLSKLFWDEDDLCKLLIGWLIDIFNSDHEMITWYQLIAGVKKSNKNLFKKNTLDHFQLPSWCLLAVGAGWSTCRESLQAQWEHTNTKHTHTHRGLGASKANWPSCCDRVPRNHVAPLWSPLLTPQ